MSDVEAIAKVSDREQLSENEVFIKKEQKLKTMNSRVNKKRMSVAAGGDGGDGGDGSGGSGSKKNKKVSSGYYFIYLPCCFLPFFVYLLTYILLAPPFL